MKVLGLTAIIAGSVLVVLSFFWVIFFPPEDQWSPEQAKELSQAAAKYHQLQHSVGGPSRATKSPGAKAEPRATQADLDAAKKRWEESDSALRSAQSGGQRMAWWLRLGGVAIAALGVGALLAAKRREPSRAARRASY